MCVYVFGGGWNQVQFRLSGADMLAAADVLIKARVLGVPDLSEEGDSPATSRPNALLIWIPWKVRSPLVRQISDIWDRPPGSVLDECGCESYLLRFSRHDFVAEAGASRKSVGPWGLFFGT